MRLPQVLHATGSSRIDGIATIVRCLACEKTAAEARVAVVWGNIKRQASCHGPQLNKACLPEHCRGCGLHGEHRLLSDT
ncbi:unnamed protein product [Ectocarpus sp. 8 AP-2014]